MEKSKHRSGRRMVCLGLCLALLFSFAGCKQDDPNKKTTVTMMYPIALEQFQKLVADTYPDIDLQVESTTSGAMNGDSERRLRNGKGTDLVVTTLPTGEVKDYMLDLSATESASSYQATVMSSVMSEGKTIYLPLPGQYAGYILNKTLLEQLGKPVPTSPTDIMALLDAGKAEGLGIGADGTMFGIDTINTAAIGSYLIGTRVPDFLGDVYKRQTL